MNSNDILTILLTSATISTLVSFLLRIIFESRLQHYFDKQIEQLRQEHARELERVKASFLVDVDMAHQILERKIGIYPKIVELIYRTRNVAREILYSTPPMATLFSELETHVSELDEQIFSSRMDLERDGVFENVHEYKNTIMTFYRLGKDLRHFHKNNNKSEVKNTIDDMNNLFPKLETNYRLAINQLSKASTQHE